MDTPHPTRGLFGLLILALPIALVVVVFAAYGGLFALGLGGRAGTRPVTLVFRTCPEAEPVIRDRLADMGYAATFVAVDGGFEAAFDGPDDPDLLASLPVDLARPGAFEVRHRGEVLATGADVTESSVRVDAMMTPTTLVHLGEGAGARVADAVRADPSGALDFFLDGERIGGQAHAAVARGEVEVAPPLSDPAERLRATAAWSVLIDHPPLPCPADAGTR